MSATSAQVLVPSTLPADTGEWARAFALRLRDEIAMPLFASRTEEELNERLPDLLVRGATLRFRWLNALSEMPADESQALSTTWMRPPPPALLDELQRRGAGLLGQERSFQVQRALALTFTDAMTGFERVMAKWAGSGRGPRWLVELARLTEAGASHDVMSLAWMALLLGDVAPPNAQVAHAASTALLRCTSDRLRAMQAVIGDEVVVRDIPLDQVAVPHTWLQDHRGLILPLLTLVGFALDDPSVHAIVLDERPDPEDAGLSLMEIRLFASGEPDDARLRVEEHALRAGVLGSMGDDRGLIAITSAPVSPG